MGHFSRNFGTGAGALMWGRSKFCSSVSNPRKLLPGIQNSSSLTMVHLHETPIVFSLGMGSRSPSRKFQKFPKFQHTCFHTVQPLQSSDDDKKPPPAPSPYKKEPVNLPYLMPNLLIMWPSIVQTFKNWFFYHFVIRKVFDKDFNMAEFDRGARQAISYVSKRLANGKFEELEDLVDPEALSQVKDRIATRYTQIQRELLEFEVGDIFFSFPYQVGIIQPDPPPPLHRQAAQSEASERLKNSEPEKRLVEITVVVHVLHGFHKQLAAGQLIPHGPFISGERVMVCNYRFLKEFTEGAPNQNWIINRLNHFLPVSYQGHGVPN